MSTIGTMSLSSVLSLSPRVYYWALVQTIVVTTLAYIFLIRLATEMSEFEFQPD